MKKKVSVYLRNHDEGPSCYYRIMQYVDRINEIDFKINDALCLSDFRKNMDTKSGWRKKICQMYFFLKITLRRFSQICSDLISRPDEIIIQREVFPRVMPFFFASFYKKILSKSWIIWDFDDAIQSSREISDGEWRLLSECSDVIVATSSYLLNSVESLAKKIRMPTTDGFCDLIDLNVCQKKRIEKYENSIKLVWVGTHSNLKNIIEILPELNNAGAVLKKQNKTIELDVVCNIDAPELYVSYENLKISFSVWTRDVAQNAILNAHIGLMPLPDNVFSKGKGGFKLIQYIASGIPVIASDIGFNKEIIDDSFGFLANKKCDWTFAIVYFGSNLDRWIKAGCFAREKYIEKFSYKENLCLWKKLMCNPNEISV